MRTFKRWLLSILLIAAMWFTVSTALSSRRSFAAYEAAKTEVLGTLHCHREAPTIWSGTAHFNPPFRRSHGVGLAQPAEHGEAWKDVKITGTLVSENRGDSQRIEAESDFGQNGLRQEALIAFGPGQGAGDLTVSISGLPASIEGEQLDIDIVNILCGLEKMIGIVEAAFACGGALISLVLAAFVRRAWSAPATIPA